MSTVAGRITAGLASGLAGFGGGLALKTATSMAQANQMPAPAARTAKPFGIDAEAGTLQVGTEALAQDSRSQAAIASGGLAGICASKMVNNFPNVIKRIPGTDYWGTVLAIISGNDQMFGIQLETKQQPERCVRAGFQLRGKAMAFTTQPENHRDRYRVTTLPYGNHAGGKQRLVSVPYTFHYKRVDYQCTPGKGKTPALLELANRVVDRHHHVLKEKRRWLRVPVRGPHNNAAC